MKKIPKITATPFMLTAVMLSTIILVLIFTVNAMSADPASSLNRKVNKDAPELPEYLPETQDKNFTLPPLPENRPDVPGAVLFDLKGVTFEGNTVFSEMQLKEVAAPFLNRKVGMADLEEIRYQLTRYYIDKGYVNSGALIKPGQKVNNGVVIYLIIEGKLTDIKMKGNERLRENYIKKRIWSDATIPFNTGKLQDSFQMLLQDPLIDRMDGRIVPGIKPGEAALELDVTRARPYELSITADNHSSPNLGSEKLSLNQTVRNLTGFGDSLNTLLNFTEGIREIDATYSIPLNANNTLLSLNYSYSDNDIVAKSLDSIGIESKLESSRISFTHPVYYTLRRNFNIGLSLKSEESRTYLMNGTPFSFAQGAEDGKSRTTTVQLIQSFSDRTTQQVLALRSTFSFGIDMLDPTIHSESIPDGKFTSWLGQAQYGRRIGEKAGQVIFRGDLQFADDRLLSMEQFSLGGAQSVRGYRENERIGDNGYLLSLEWRIPVWESQKTGGQQKTRLIQIAPFMDYGSAWDKEYFKVEKSQTGDKFIYSRSQSDNVLHSVGVGVLWSSPSVDAQIYYGYAIKDRDTDAVDNKDDYNFQDDGIHFSVTYNLL
ncbi:MAG: ShlB/FhaC/HecB family hemolysin secretion/activation protein [Desulfamplus sp.]|nr:ShlB/FhaC/HecB family hemolysin secretion/activation protein [Desulfamplus sp.]